MVAARPRSRPIVLREWPVRGKPSEPFGTRAAEGPLWVKGGRRGKVDATADLPSAPEVVHAPRQLRLVPKGEVRGFEERRHAPEDLAELSVPRSPCEF